MPTSHHNQLSDIVGLIVRTKPRSILNVGVGFGKYEFLSREYLELWDGRETGYHDRKSLIEGIELSGDFITPAHEYIYDKIYIGDALEVAETLERTYDLILLIDVIEHMDYSKGAALLEKLVERGRNVIVSTPLDIGPDDKPVGYFESPPHRCQWNKKYFSRYKNIFFVGNECSLICYIGLDASLVKAKLRASMRRRIAAKCRIPLPLVKLAGTLRRTFFVRSDQHR